MPSYFYSLDALRGLAALSLVLFHWRHFFYDGTAPGPFDASRLPLYGIFGLAYMGGGKAVYFFFSLSGFLFFWLYSGRIADRSVSAREFFVRRLSRLYPLHVATLLIVAALQWGRTIAGHDYFVYRFNDAYHFALQLVFLSGLGVAKGLSFNGPVWSVSIEVVLYAVFFGICVINKIRWWHLLPFACAGLLLMSFGTGPFAGGILSFFIGSLAFCVFNRLRSAAMSHRAVDMFAMAVLALWIAAFVFAANSASLRTAGDTTAASAVELRYSLSAVPSTLAALWLEILVYPTTIITVALLETHRPKLFKRFAVLGALSYSSYLLHFPLQLIFAAATHALGPEQRAEFYYSPISLILFMGTLIPLSLWVNRKFERPAQSILRRRFLSRREYPDLSKAIGGVKSVLLQRQLIDTKASWSSCGVDRAGQKTRVHGVDPTLRSRSRLLAGFLCSLTPQKANG